MGKVGSLSPPLLGARDYITGASILDGLVSLVGPLEALRIRFKKLSCHILDVYALPDETFDSSPTAPVATLQTLRGTDSVRYALYQTSTPLAERIPYDEADCTRQCLFTELTVSQDEAPLGWTGVQRIVALNKALLVQTTGVSKWLFVEMSLAEYPVEPMSVHIEASITKTSTRLVRSKIFFDGRYKGDVLFAPGPETNGQ